MSLKGARLTRTHSLTLLFTHVHTLLYTTDSMHTHIHSHLSEAPREAPAGKTGDL